ncbi:MAG: hypothetical protein KF726_24050, partial [Anaerolineae bacterium]|nr:hypothetical protein [Anaerolineae bacterium]
FSKIISRTESAKTISSPNASIKTCSDIKPHLEGSLLSCTGSVYHHQNEFNNKFHSASTQIG